MNITHDELEKMGACACAIRIYKDYYGIAPVELSEVFKAESTMCTVDFPVIKSWVLWLLGNLAYRRNSIQGTEFMLDYLDYLVNGNDSIVELIEEAQKFVRSDTLDVEQLEELFVGINMRRTR